VAEEKSYLIKSSFSRNFRGTLEETRSTHPASAGFLFVVLRIPCATVTDRMEFCLRCDKVHEKGCCPAPNE